MAIKVACITEENIGSGAISFANSIDDTDALITNLKNVPLTLFFADCTPNYDFMTLKTMLLA